MTAAPEQKLDRSGVASALAAFVFWGLVPAYYKALQEVGSWEVLAHRVIWSVPILLVFLLVRDGRAFWRRLGLPLRSIAWLVLSGLTISLNWLIFVWAVANGHILDTSLGYFLTPLVTYGLWSLLFHAAPALLITGLQMRLGAGPFYARFGVAACPVDRCKQRGELLKRLITAQEDERKRLARELHDELGQALAGLGLHSEAIEQMLRSDPERARGPLRPSGLERLVR